MMKSASLWRRQSWSKRRWNVKRLLRPILGPNFQSIFGRNWRYSDDGYFQKNDLNAYSLNNITSKKDADGSVAVQFGGCDGSIPNCLPTMPGWNYTVRLYRPCAEILSGVWKFPEAEPVVAGWRALQ